MADLREYIQDILGEAEAAAGSHLVRRGEALQEIIELATAALTASPAGDDPKALDAAAHADEGEAVEQEVAAYLRERDHSIGAAADDEERMTSALDIVAVVHGQPCPSGVEVGRSAQSGHLAATYEAAITAAIDAYDAERIACHRQWHGGNPMPASAINKKNLRPIIAAAVNAALATLRGSAEASDR